MTEILDHGYIRLVEAWGSDERIVESARMSTGGGFRGWGERHDTSCPATQPAAPGSAFGGECNCKPKPGDERLLRYLYEHKHSTPFEMCGLTVEVKAPIFVFRQWHRHRTQSYSEMSARYVEVSTEFYIPTPIRVHLDGGANKQSGGRGQVDGVAAGKFVVALRRSCEQAAREYDQALAGGVPRELARLLLPVNTYSVMRASANLRNWLAFIALRSAPDAQWEIRQYSDAIAEIVRDRFPRTWDIVDG